MVKKLGLVLFGLCLVSVLILKANAQQTPSSGNPHGQGEAAQLRQEIQSLQQQAEQLRAQIQQIEAQAKPIREQLNSIHQKIKADRAKLLNLREEHKGQRQEHQQTSTGSQK